MKVYKILGIEQKEVDVEKATLEAIFSTDDEDRHGDVVVQNWDLKYFKKNPVILNSHNYGDAGEVIGKATNVKVKDGKLEGKIEFAVKENPKAKVIFDLYAGGFLNAFSVGFIPKEWSDKGEILKSELLEVSAVSVPANAMALAKAKGIEINKLYEPAINDNLQNKAGNGTNAEEDSDGGQGDGQKGNGESRENGGDDKNKGVKNKEFENWEDGDREIRLKIRDLDEFEAGSFERITLKGDLPRVYAIVGTIKGDSKKSLQMMFFPKDDGWTVDDARKWFSQRQYSLLHRQGQEEDKKKPAKETDGRMEVENEDSINSGKSIDGQKVKAWDETENEIRYQIRKPELFQSNSFRTISFKKDKPKIKAIVGKLKEETKTILQSLRFVKDDGWTVSAAKSWVKEHADDLKGKMATEAIARAEISKVVGADNEVVFLDENKQKIFYQKIALVTERLSKIKKVETRSETVRAENIKAINKAVRKLLKLKREMN